MGGLSAKASCRVAPATSSTTTPLAPPPLPPPPTDTPRGQPAFGADDVVPGYFANVSAQATAKWKEVGGWAGIQEKVVASAQSVQEKARHLDHKHNISENVKEGMVKTEAQVRESAKKAKARAKVLDQKHNIRKAAFTNADRRLGEKASAETSNFLTKLANIPCA